MPGLERGAVRLADHDPTWRVAFEEFASAIRLHTGLSSDRVEHVGSTSVPELVAKPIVDIVVGADTQEDIDSLAGKIAELGYIDRGSGEGSNGRLLVRESAPDVRIIHLHIVVFRSEHWRHYVVFRDALRSDPGLRRRYALLKSSLAEQFRTDRKSYTSAKQSFIVEALVARGVRV